MYSEKQRNNILIMNNYTELENRVLIWASQKGVLDNAEPINQGLKTLEEVNELLVAIVNDDIKEVEDALGDILVTIIIGADMQGLNLLECLESALNVIEKRKGKMINGTFVKE